MEYINSFFTHTYVTWTYGHPDICPYLHKCDPGSCSRANWYLGKRHPGQRRFTVQPEPNLKGTWEKGLETKPFQAKDF